MLNSTVIPTCIVLIAMALVGCDAEHMASYAKKEYETAVAEGKAYADSVELSKQIHLDSTVYLYDHMSKVYCHYKTKSGKEKKTIRDYTCPNRP